MSEEIVWGAGMDDAEFNRGIKRMLKEIETLKQKLKETQDESKKGSQQQKSAFDSAIASLGKMAAGWLSVQTAIQVATASYQDYLNVQRESASETISTADAQIKFFRNLGNVSREESKKIQEQIRAIASSVGQPVKNVYAVATEAISAQGNLSRKQMFANVAMGLRLAPESVSEATALAGTLGDVASLTGNADPLANAGLMLALGEQTRIANMQQIGKNVIPAAIGVKETLRGTSANDAMALVTTLTSVMKDREGALSGTASVQLAQQLDSFFGADAKVSGPKDKEGALLKKLGDGTLLEQMAKLRADPKAMAAFLSKSSFEAKAKPFVEQLLTKDSAAAMLFEQNRAKVPTGDAARAQAAGFFANIAGAPEQQLAGAERAFVAAESQLQLGNESGSRASVVYEGMQKALRSSGRSLPARISDQINWHVDRAMGAAPEDIAIRSLQNQANYLRRGFVGNANQPAADKNVEMQAQKLDALIAELRGLRGDQKNGKKKNIDQHTE